MTHLDADNAVALVLAAHRAFAVTMLGPVISGVDAPEIAQLIQLGFLTEDEAAHGWTVPGVDVPMDPFQFAVMMGGIMADEAAEPGVLRKSWDEVTRLRKISLRRWADRMNYRLRKRIRTGEPSVTTRYTGPDYMTPEEAGAWLSARTRAGVYITQIGDNARVEVRAMVAQAITDQLNWGEFTAKLNARLGAWSRDWQRVARTELQGAYNEGVLAAAMADRGRDARIARVPERDACEQCIRVFIEDGRPRIFGVLEITRNGTNVGRHKDDWMATVWPIHPNCRCDTVHVPPGYGFNSAWQLVPSSEVDKAQVNPHSDPLIKGVDHACC